MKLLILLLITKHISSNIEIIQPAELRKKFTIKDNEGAIQYSVSTFGQILYSEKMTVQIVLPQKLDNQTGCESLSPPKQKLIDRQVWLLKRGDCTYSKKAFIAQQSGAYALLVYFDDDTDITNVIPTADSISKQIIESIQSNNDVLLSIDIDLPGESTDIVRGEYWMNPVSLKSYDILMEFQPVLQDFGAYVQFKPLYKFKELEDEFVDSFLKEHCYFKGRYCSVDQPNISSMSILQEGVRQICLWNLGQSDKEFKNIWWNYINNYRLCLINKLQKKTEETLDCYEEILQDLSVGNNLQQKVQDCIDQSFENKEDMFYKDNMLLRSNMNKNEYQGVYLVPAFFINDNMVKEDLVNEILISAICEKLIQKPEICQKADLVIDDFNYHKEQKKVSGLLLFSILLLSGLVVLFLIIFCIKRSLKNQIDGEVSVEIHNHVAEYIRIRESQIEE